MKKRKKYILIAIAAAIVIIAVVLYLRPRNIVFYHQLPFRFVSKENKTVTAEIYQEHKEYLSQILVAEDSRSGKSIRFVFLFDTEPSAQVRDQILKTLYDHLQYMWDIYYSNPGFPGCWEVFFCSGDAVNSAYVSRMTILSRGGVSNSIENRFGEWEKVPQGENRLNLDIVKQMLERTSIAMYPIRDPSYEAGDRPIAEIEPDLPPASP